MIFVVVFVERFEIQPLQELKENNLAEYPQGFFSVALLAAILVKYDIILCVVKADEQGQPKRTYIPFASDILPSTVLVVGLVHNPITKCFHTVSANDISVDPFGISANVRVGGIFQGTLGRKPNFRSVVQESLGVMLNTFSAHLERQNKISDSNFEFPKLKIRSSIFSDLLMKKAAKNDQSSSSEVEVAAMSEHSSSSTREVATVRDDSSSTAMIDQSSNSNVEVTAMSEHSSSTREFATIRDGSSSMEVANAVSEIAISFNAVAGFRMGHQFESIFPQHKRLVDVNRKTGEVIVTQTLPVQPVHGNSASTSDTKIIFQPNTSSTKELLFNIFANTIHTNFVSSDQLLHDQVNIVCDLLVGTS